MKYRRYRVPVVEDFEDLWTKRARRLWKRVSFQYLRVIEGIVFPLAHLAVPNTEQGDRECA